MKLRRPTAADTSFLVDSWSKSARTRLSAAERDIVTHERVVEQIARIMQRPGARARVGTIEVPDGLEGGTVDRIVAWGVAEPAASMLHFVYVRHDYRGRGLAAQIAEALFGGEHVAPTLAADPVPKLRRSLERKGWRVASHLFYLEAAGATR